MADSTLSALPAASALGGTEIVYGVQSSADVKITATQIKTFATAAPMTLASGTLTDPSAALTITQTWNDAADSFLGMTIDVSRTAAALGSSLFRARLTSDNNAGMELYPQAADNTCKLLLRDVFGTNGGIKFAGSTNMLFVGNTVCISFDENGGGSGLGAYLAADRPLGWSSSNASGSGLNTRDISLHRIGAGVLGVRGAASTDGGALNFVEQTAPSAPSSNEVVIYAEDNGSGKTRLMARFATGAAQQIAIEP